MSIASPPPPPPYGPPPPPPPLPRSPNAWLVVIIPALVGGLVLLILWVASTKPHQGTTSASDTTTTTTQSEAAPTPQPSLTYRDNWDASKFPATAPEDCIPWQQQFMDDVHKIVTSPVPGMQMGLYHEASQIVVDRPDCFSPTDVVQAQHYIARTGG